MKYVAYKTSQNSPNLPNGFIIDHFETDDIEEPGYIVVEKDVFSQLLITNISLIRSHEDNRGIVAADPNSPAPPQMPNNHAEPASVNMMTQRTKEIQKNQEDLALFQQFLAWKASQDSGSGS